MDGEVLEDQLPDLKVDVEEHEIVTLTTDPVVTVLIFHHQLDGDKEVHDGGWGRRDGGGTGEVVEDGGPPGLGVVGECR